MRTSAEMIQYQHYALYFPDSDQESFFISSRVRGGRRKNANNNSQHYLFFGACEELVVSEVMIYEYVFVGVYTIAVRLLWRPTMFDSLSGCTIILARRVAFGLPYSSGNAW